MWCRLSQQYLGCDRTTVSASRSLRVLPATRHRGLVCIQKFTVPPLDREE
jgi:hypothetical protein